MTVLGWLARLVGAILSLIVDMRRVKCRDHYPEPMHYPPTCISCWKPIE